MEITLTDFEEELKSKFLNQTKFSSEIENFVKNGNINYIEAIVQYCENHGIELEKVPKLLSKPLKERLRCEAMELNYLKRTSRAKLDI
jgi:DNA-directed RNA polymerase alpha subunit